MMRGWIHRRLRQWLGISDLDHRLMDMSVTLVEIEGAVFVVSGVPRLVATENSLRLIEERLRIIEAVKTPEGEALGEFAARQAVNKREADKLRLDTSAAEARDMTLDQYRAMLDERHRRKAEKRNVS
jgi:hypothetical protein